MKAGEKQKNDFGNGNIETVIILHWCSPFLRLNLLYLSKKVSHLIGIYYDSSKAPEWDNSSVSVILDVQHSPTLQNFVTKIFICQHLDKVITG